MKDEGESEPLEPCATRRGGTPSPLEEAPEGSSLEEEAVTGEDGALRSRRLGGGPPIWRDKEPNKKPQVETAWLVICHRN